MRYLTADQVLAVHDRVISPAELQGMAQSRPVQAVIGRIENRLAYGLCDDPYELAACYACYLAVGHCFHDANKRSAHTAMQLVLKINGISLEYAVEQMGQRIVMAARGEIDEEALAIYLGSMAV